MSFLLIIFDRSAKFERDNSTLRIFTKAGSRTCFSKIIRNIKINHYQFGNQHNPFFENETYLICITGEIYEIEKKAVKKDETGSYLLDYITKNGIDTIPNIDGEFTLFVYHKIKEEAYIFNDLFGFYPLYYYTDQDNIVLCNEIEPVVGFVKQNLQLDNDSIAEHFCLDHVLGNKTFYKDIFNLAPGSKIVIGPEYTFHTSTYITTRLRTIDKPEINDIARQLAFLLKKAVEKRELPSEKNIFTLTAGLDTRMIAECADKNSRHNQSFITYLDPKLTDETDQDVMIARQIAKKGQLNLSIKDYNFFAEEMDTSYYKNIRNGLNEKKFSGVFGSELIRCEINHSLDTDYFNFIMCLAKKKSLRHLDFVKKRKAFSQNIDSKLKLFSRDFIKTIHPLVQNIEREYFSHEYYDNKQLYYFVLLMTRSFYLNIYGGTRSYLMDRPSNILISHKIPFLDRDLLLFLLSIPYKFYMENIVEIYNVLFTKYFVEYGDILTNSSFTSNPQFVVGKISTGINQIGVRDYKNVTIAEYASRNDSYLDFVFDKPVSSIISDNENLMNQKILDYTLWSKYMKEITE